MVKEKLDHTVFFVGDTVVPSALLHHFHLGNKPLIAIDGGADRCKAVGITPSVILGDLDSLKNRKEWQDKEGVRVLHFSDQETTDFEKGLSTFDAPMYVALGMLGGERFDHSLAAMHAILVYAEKKIILTGGKSLAFLMPPLWQCLLKLGTLISIFPISPVFVSDSRGLEWSLRRKRLVMGKSTSISNRVVENHVMLACDRPGAVIVLDISTLDDVIYSLEQSSSWRT